MAKFLPVFSSKAPIANSVPKRTVATGAFSKPDFSKAFSVMFLVAPTRAFVPVMPPINPAEIRESNRCLLAISILTNLLFRLLTLVR